MCKSQFAEFQNAVVRPISITTSYYFETSKDVIDYHKGIGGHARYARYDNAAWRDLERQMAFLDECEDAAVFPSGMSAVFNTLVSLCRQGDHVVYSGKGYRNITNLCSEVLPKFGITSTRISPSTIASGSVQEQILAAITSRTRAIFIEMPSNPHLLLTDLQTLRLNLPADCLLLVDSTVATPINFKPAEYGADLVVHSLGKYIAGHSNAMGGSVAGSGKHIDKIKAMRNVNGSICDSGSVSRIQAGLQTLKLRMEFINQSAIQIADWLERHPLVRRVFYTGLPTHPHSALAKKMFDGHGGLITFELEATLEQTMKFVDEVDVAYMATGFGGVQTFIEQPALFTYYNQSEADRTAAGITDSLVRLSVGIDPTARIIESLSSAFDRGIRSNGSAMLKEIGNMTNQSAARSPQ